MGKLLLIDAPPLINQICGYPLAFGVVVTMFVHSESKHAFTLIMLLLRGFQYERNITNKEYRECVCISQIVETVLAEHVGGKE